MGIPRVRHWDGWYYSILKLMPEKEKIGIANRVVAWLSAVVISAILTAFSWQYAVAFLGIL